MRSNTGSQLYADSRGLHIGCGSWFFQSAEWPTNPAFSRNPKPPALAGGVFIPKYNDYPTHRPETLYFNYDEAMRLKDALSEKAISIFIEKAKKQAEIDAEFN